MEVVVVNALRARDQVGVLASATTAGILATDGHVVAKLVWDLVVSTAAVFVLRVAKIGAARDLCVRVSPLLLGIVGEIQDGEYCCVVLPDDARYMLKRKYECTGWERVVLYTGARPAATEPDKRIRGYGGGGVDEGGGGGVLLCQKPVWFKTECEVVTPKWIALFGGRDDGGWPIGREKFLLLHRWGDRLSSEFVHCGIPLTIFADGVLAILAFNSTRFDDNQLLLVLNKSDELGPHLHIINIIDAEQTHVTGKLCIVSTTMFSFPALRIQNLFVMRKNSGTRSFFCTGVSDPGMRFVRFSVAEVSGCVTQLAQPFTQVQPVNNSVFFLRDRADNVFICDCNDPTNPSPVAVPRYPESDEYGTGDKRLHRIGVNVFMNSGFLFYSDWSHITVMEPFSGSCVLTLQEKLGTRMIVGPPISSSWSSAM